MSEGTTIYALCDPDGSVRYVGQTRDSRRRLGLHLRSLRSRGRTSALHEWLRALIAAGGRPTLVALEEVAPHQAAQAEARQIREHLARGCKLTNRATPRGALALGARVSADVGPRVYGALLGEAKDRSCTLSWLVRSILEHHTGLAADGADSEARHD